MRARGGNSTIKVVAKKDSKAMRFIVTDNRKWLSIMTRVNAALS